jgi:superfamily II DNA or RNA helicase
MIAANHFSVGALVKARGREWVVLPESNDQLLVLRPLGGTDDETTGIYLPLENVEPASFDLPDPTQPGDYRSCRLLRDAVRLGFRSSAGPFRSFARIAVEPRPYQLVPLLVALKLNPVRILIADDVGIGKTIEAGLIARELLDRGEVSRLAVLCPPQLAEQWQVELRDKFHIDAELVLPSTATRLERNCRIGQSLFEVYPFVIVSTEFIKSDRRREEFLRTCPELVIVDEAHTCAWAGEGRGSKHQRHHLVAGLAANKERHLILVTATPHSGKDEAFRSLLQLLNPSFENLPDDLSGKENEHHRRKLAAHFVQRRRADIRHYLDADTPFPERDESDKGEATYKLSPEYKQFLDRILRYARETVSDPTLGQFRQRVRWWSALALLRSIASSPAAAAATLRSRASSADTETPEEADEVGKRTVLDLMDDESAEGVDLVPGSDTGEEDTDAQKNQRRLREMAREADALTGVKDAKLLQAITLVEKMLKDGYQPIVFCRFIPTAEYIATALREKLSKGVEVAAVTGTLPPDEREARVLQLAQSPRRVLVATDCLSEGINLQEHFDAVLHYDLSWNPTRHEQREGRVDRYGQPSKKIRVLTYYGVDNLIDGVVLQVLIRKHQAIRNTLGISVPVPLDTEQVVQSIFEGLLLRNKESNPQNLLPGFDEVFKPQREDLFRAWDAASEREKRSRTMFAQETIKVDEVARELQAVRAAIGSGVDVERFTIEGFQAHGATVSRNGDVKFDVKDVPRGLLDAIDVQAKFVARFELPIKEGQIYLSRTQPIVEGLASFVMDTALDPLSTSLRSAQDGGGVARRCGVIRTSRVQKRTTLLLVRLRYHIITRRGRGHKVIESPLLAEDCQLLAFTGPPQNAEWLDGKIAEELLLAQPEANIQPDQATHFLRQMLNGFDAIRPHLDEVARQRGEELLDAHRRVRIAAHETNVSHRVEPQLPCDMLGVYIYLPMI